MRERSAEASAVGKPTSTPRLAILVPWGPAHALWGIAGLAVAGAAAGGVFLVLSLFSDAEGTPVWIFAASTLVLQAGMVAVAYVLGPRLAGEAPGILLGVRRLATGPLFAWGAAAFFGSIIAGVLYLTLAERISGSLVPPPLPEQIDLDELRVLTFAIVVIAAPMAEETFFRGFLFAGFLSRLGLWPAAALSAGVFAATHVDIALLGPAFLAGLVFALVYWRTGSVWPGILAHTTQNAIAFGLAT